MDIPATARALAWSQCDCQQADVCRRCQPFAEQIESALRAAQAAALREAAEELETFSRDDFYHAAARLRDRASRAEGTGKPFIP
jgi:hypothetical protein